MQVNKAAEEPDFAGVDVMYLPLSLESAHIEGKYALLAAVHDECVASPDADELIHPWASEADFGGPDKVVNVDPEVLYAVVTYVHLMANILPDQVGRGIERSKSYRLLGVLRAVANDVKSAAKVWAPDRSICADESGPDPVEEYESFLRRTDAETSNGGTTTQANQDETPDDNGQSPAAKPLEAAGGGTEEPEFPKTPTAIPPSTTENGGGQDQETQGQVTSLLERIKAATLDETAGEFIRIASDTSKKIEDRCLEICGLDVRYWAKDSGFWKRLFDCSYAAITKTDFWKVDRPNALEEVQSAYIDAHPDQKNMSQEDMSQAFNWYKKGGSKEA